MKRLLSILALVTLLTLTNVSAAYGDALPDSAYISGVTGRAQGYSLSCEARSAADWVAFWGVSIGESEFLEALPRADNPEQGFVGNPNDTWGYIPPHGYGVHAGPVADTLREFGLEAEAHNNLDWDNLREEINAGRPVIVWVIGQMWDGTPVEYEAEDGSTVRVAAFEHTMILVGYGPDTVQVVDAYSGQYQTYWLSTFLKSWAVLGNMAVFGSREASSNDDSQPVTHGESYTVQRGDYLVELADRFGTTWQELAQLNSIGFPYTIYPGQVLQLPGEEEIQPEPVEPSPSVNQGDYQVQFPMVLRNYTAQTASSVEITRVVPASTDTVMVLHSDTLVSFGHSLGVDWRLLAKLNGLHTPYIVYPGEVLRLR